MIISELGRRNITLRNGDHAAALLIRDEFVSQTLALLPNFERQAGNLDLARAARDAAQQRAEVRRLPFWRDSKAVFVKERAILWDIETEYSLAETLDIETIAEEQEVDAGQVQSWADEQTVAAAGAYVERMELAASFALEIDDCDVGALLAIAGHRAAPIVDAISPRLVKLEADAGPPQRQYWVQDHVARGFVRSLHVTGAAIRALEEYSAADTNVAVAVSAIVTMGTSLVLELAGYAAAALWLSLTDSAIGLATGLMGVQDYLEGELIHEVAQGAAPAMGDDILNNARAGRQSPLMTAVGVILPTVSGSSQISQLRRLRHFSAVQRGERLFQSAAGNILDDLSSLDDASRTDLAAYYMDMVRRSRGAGIEGLSAAEQAALAKFDDLIRREGAVPPGTAELRPGDAAGSTAPTATDTTDTGVARPSGPEAVDPDATVEVRPSSDPNEMATEIGPNPWQDNPDLFPEPVEPGPRPGDAENIYELDPGERLAARGVTEEDIRELIRRSAEGETLSADEMLDKLDYMRLQRQQARDAAGAAGDGATE